MLTNAKLNELIEKAALKAGSQNKLAAMLDMEPSNLIKIKKGERPANWRVRGALRAILGEDPARAFMTAMAEDLEQSEQPDEKKAAEGFKSILAAFPAEKEKAPSDESLEAFTSWRKRRDSNSF